MPKKFLPKFLPGDVVVRKVKAPNAHMEDITLYAEVKFAVIHGGEVSYLIDSVNELSTLIKVKEEELEAVTK